MLNNNSKVPLSVAITVYNLRGEAYELPTREIPKSSPVYVELERELSLAPKDFSRGNLQCRYSGLADQLTGQVSIVNAAARISFQATMAMGGATTRLSSVVSVATTHAQGFVAVTNLSTHEIRVTDGGAGRDTIRLGARATEVLELNELVRAMPGRPGLITLRHDGAPGELSAAGIVFDINSFSSTLLFVDPGEAVSNTLAGAHFYSGAASKMFGLPENGRFRGILALANTSASPTQATVSVDYTIDNRGRHIQIAAPFLPAGEVVEIDVTEKLHAMGVDEFQDAGVDVSYIGAPGSVIASLKSVDTTAGLTFDTPVKDPLAGMYRSSGSHPWRLDGSFNTAVALKNVLPKTVYAMVVLRFDGGQYALPRVTLGPFQTVSISLRDVVATAKKDLDGNSPPSSQIGKVLWFQEEPDSLIGRAEISDVRGRTTASFSCFYPCNCGLPYFTPNTSDTWLYPGNITLPYLGTQLISTDQRRYDCNDSNLGTFDVTSSTAYSSGNSGIFQFTSSTIQAVGAGSTTFGGQTLRNTEAPPACPVQSQADPGGSGTVCQVTINSASVASNQISTTLSPSNLSGPFSLWQSRSGSQDNTSQQNVTRNGGPYTDGFALTTSTPTGQYATIYAEWSACSAAIVTTYNYHFYNYGQTHQSQYTLISQSTCSGAQTKAYIITNLAACFSSGLQTTTLASDFEAQVALNGTGKRGDGTYLKALAATSCLNATNGKPADASRANTFVVVSQVTGACNQTLSSSTVAQYGHQCGLRIFISGYGNPGTVKTVQDECPACRFDPPHFDNWTNAGGPSCGFTVPDLPPTGMFVTEQVQQ